MDSTSSPDIGRNHPAMILTDQKIFVGLGSVDSNNLGDWWEYDIEGNSWIQKSDFTFGNRHHPFYFLLIIYHMLDLVMEITLMTIL